MESAFSTYFELGFEHISDLKAYDHILFVVVLCAIYKLSEWKRVAILVTAFTIGHSLTLALAALNIIRFPVAIIEFLIPLTIFLTALYNVILYQSGEEKKKVNLNYFFALIFGLIHGMGFSNFFRSTLLPGEESNLVQTLLAFNLGVEAGQLLIVGFILVITYLALNIVKVRQREWNLFISGAAAGIAMIMMMERVPW